MGTFSAPPFQVRDADTINSELNDAALPDYYVQIALTEFNNHDIHDDASTDGCSFINTVGHDREFDKTVWDPYNWMIVQSEEPVEAALDVT